MLTATVSPRMFFTPRAAVDPTDGGNKEFENLTANYTSGTADSNHRASDQWSTCGGIDDTEADIGPPPRNAVRAAHSADPACLPNRGRSQDWLPISRQPAVFAVDPTLDMGFGHASPSDPCGGSCNFKFFFNFVGCSRVQSVLLA
jgi:hypothetical protein